MKMQKKDIITAAAILADMRLNAIKDKGVKTRLILDHLKLRKAAVPAEDEVREIQVKFQADFRKELTAEEKSATYREAEADANAIIEAILSKEVNMDLEPVSLADFLEVEAGDRVTVGQVSFLAEHGIIDA